MPLTHERTFRIRQYECDAYGHLNNTNYLRYMQEAAFDASTAAGYGFERYLEMGRTWLPRATEVTYLQPLRYGQAVTVRTWIAESWRTHSLRAYEFQAAGSGELAARAATDWAFLESASGRPAEIPDSLLEDFYPEGAPARATRRRRFPPAPPPPGGVFRLPKRVQWQDIDPQGHVNNAVYVAYAEDCGVQVAAAFGWPMARCTEHGFGIIVRRHQIEYHQPAFLDEELVVSTWASDLRRSSGIRHYFIDRAADGARLARLRSSYVWLDLEAGRPVRIPEVFLADFAPNLVE